MNYGAYTALDRVTVEVFPGEVVGLIGPNGAGKTSFIKAICGRVPASGEIYLDGTQMSRGQSRQEKMGLVPQDIGLYPHMSCLENLEAFAQIMGLKGRERRVAAEEALASVFLTKKSDALVQTLSGGMQRRLNVASAIMHCPKFLILDEPTAGTDMPARDSIHRLTRSLAETGMGILLVTHELEQVEALCDRVLVFVKGRCLAEGSTSEILEQCFGERREIFIRFSQTPLGLETANPETPNLETLNFGPFEFAEGELPTLWSCVTDKATLARYPDILSDLQNNHPKICEIGIRRPGLPTLMQIIEKTGALPC